jgi:short-subunit dehydrogenase
MQRQILVTGASRGIGQAISKALLQQQHQVIGVARTATPELSSHTNFHTETIDLADLTNLPEQLKTLQGRYPNIDGLVLNAGRGQFGSLEEFSYEQINSLINLNFTAQAYICRAFLPLMKRQGQNQKSPGDLIFIGSEAALWGGRRGAVYSASKAALRGFAQALREECARSGIRVCVINPGMVRSSFFDNLNFQPGPDERHAISPDTVAEAVLQVLSAPPSTVFDEINLSPLQKVLRFEKN